MQDTAGEVGMNSYCCGPLHMDGQKQDNQLDPTYNIFVLIHDVALNGGRRGSGRSVLVARHEDDDLNSNLYL